MARFAIANAVQPRWAPIGGFPSGTLFVNVTGSLLLGVLLAVLLAAPNMTGEIRAMLTTGFCGGYTTFSTFSVDAVALIERGDWRRAAIYVAASLVLSLGAAAVGLVIGRAFVTPRAG